jgi:hypothetical protein
MVKLDLNKQFSFDEQGASEVNQQIMDSYNSGFMGEETAQAASVKNVESERLGAKIL